MTVEDARTRLRERLEGEYGMDGAAILMDRPPGGWNDLVTNESLRRELATQEARFDEKLDLRLGALKYELLGTMEREFRAQTWRLMTAIIAAMGTLVAAMAVFISVTRA